MSDFEDDFNYEYDDKKYDEIKFENSDEKVIYSFVTRDKMNEEELKKFDNLYFRCAKYMRGYKLNDTRWLITNYGNFIKYSDLINEFDDYHYHWELDEKLNDLGIHKKTKTKLPNLFVKFLKGVINKDSEIIEDCCNEFYSDYNSKEQKIEN
jgi:hypothetical protein